MHKSASCGGGTVGSEKNPRVSSISSTGNRRKRGREADALDEFTEDQGWFLTSRELEVLSKATALQTTLRDPRLREVLHRIDAAQDREKELQRSIREHPSLEPFLRDTLRAVGVLEKDPRGEEFLRPLS